MADLDPLCMSFWKVNPLLLTFYVRLEEGGRFIPCVCVQIKSIVVPFYILLQGCGKILHVVMLFAPKLKRDVKMVVKGWANLRFGRCVSDL